MPFTTCAVRDQSKLVSAFSILNREKELHIFTRWNFRWLHSTLFCTTTAVLGADFLLLLLHFQLVHRRLSLPLTILETSHY